MTNVFRIEDTQKAQAHLKNSGFFNSDFANFRIKRVGAQIIKEPSLFAPLVELLAAIKVTPLGVLKMQIMVQHLLQVDPNMRENEHLLRLLLKLSLRVKDMIKSETQFALKQYTEPSQNFRSSRYVVDRNGVACENGTSLILRKIVEPLLELQKRLIYSYDLVNPIPTTMELEVSQCWAVLNLLKKFVQIYPQIQTIGRYYPQKYAVAMVYLIKVLDVDIQPLYRRVGIFVGGKILQYGEFINKERQKIISDEAKTRIKQFLQLVDEVEALNESIKRLYLKSPFRVDLACNQIRMPQLFVFEPHLDLLCTLKKTTCRDEAKIWYSVTKRATLQRCRSTEYLK